MFQFLTEYFHREGIDLFSPILLSDCIIKKPYLLERAGIGDGTVIVVAVPYYTSFAADPERNLSAYAVSRNYHDYFEGLWNRLLPLLREKYPTEKFAGFADHSPIDEINAALRSGIGILGKNHLLITEKYSSYVFLGELITTVRMPVSPGEIRCCEDCGACRKACPMEACGVCLSALTQKKGEFTKEEENLILRYGSVWGCDICQEVCPHTKKAIAEGTIYSRVPYFSENPTPPLTLETLDRMDDAEFSRRAYSWRGRDPIRRNLLLIENRTKEQTPGIPGRKEPSC